MIIYRGTLTLEKLKELADKHLFAANTEAQKELAAAEAQAHTPATDGTYIIIKQKDGNYKGYTHKAGKPIEIRDVGPETVLQRLLVHE